MKKMLALLMSVCLLLGGVAALAEEEADLAALEAAGMEVEGIADDEEAVEADGAVADITGMKPLYTARIKPFTANGTSIRMRTRQDGESDVVCAIDAWETVTVFAV